MAIKEQFDSFLKGMQFNNNNSRGKYVEKLHLLYPNDRTRQTVPHVWNDFATILPNVSSFTMVQPNFDFFQTILLAQEASQWKSLKNISPPRKDALIEIYIKIVNLLKNNLTAVVVADRVGRDKEDQRGRCILPDSKKV